MMMNKLYFFLCGLLLLSCSSESTEQIDEQRLRDSIRAELEEEMKQDGNNITNAMPFDDSPSKTQPLSSVQFEGSVVTSRAWVDANGDNLAVFTSTGEEIYMYHYVFPDGSPSLKRRVLDYERDCPFDKTLGFKQNTIEVTDLDHDNYGEISFMYEKACRSDVSPAVLKYLTIENGEKYIIRGSELMDFGYEEPYGGEMTIDAKFKNGPTVFLDHAKRVWNENYRFE